MFDDHVPEQKRSAKVTALLVVVPLWLVLSAGGALWLYFHREKEKAEQRDIPRSAAPVSASDLDATMAKITTFIGERNTSSPAAAKGLESMMSMIDSTLGPGNAGYPIERIATPAGARGVSAPMVIATLYGKDSDKRGVWVLVPCDSRDGWVGAVDNGSGVAVTLSAARAMADSLPQHSIHFAFLPFGVQAAENLPAALKVLRERIAKDAPSRVLVIQRTHQNAPLQAGSANAGSVSPSLPELAKPGPAPTREESLLADELTRAGLPVTLITNGPPPADAAADLQAPSGADLAASAATLKDYLRRLADLK